MSLYKMDNLIILINFLMSFLIFLSYSKITLNKQ